MTTRELKNVCPRTVSYTIDEDGCVRDIAFAGGCQGNLHAVAALAEGLTANEIISKLEGIPCGNRGTSCPDQFAQVLKDSQ